MAQLSVVRNFKNGAVMKDEQGEIFIRIDNVRLSYPFVGTPSEDENENGEKRRNWRLVAMLDKTVHDAAYQECVKQIERILKDNEARVPKDKWFVKDGDDSEDTDMHDHWLVSAADSKNRPKVRDRKGQVMDDINKIDDTFYGGCWGHILIRPWFFNGKARNSTKNFPKRVSANLVGVMFAKDDTPFGSGRVDESDAWGGLASGNDDDGDDGL